MKTYNTESANPKLIGLIVEKNNELIANGEVQFKTLGEKEVKEVGRNKYIDPADEEKYNALYLLHSLISFKNETADYNLYEFPGFEMEGQKMRLVVPTSKAGELAEKAEFIEKHLKDYGVKFPAQLYALKPEHRGKNLPGKDYPAPSPKLMSQTDEEYEKYLEEYYKTRGVEKESDGLSFRKPYQHEQIDYKESNEVKEGFNSEYYKDQLEIHAKGKGKTIKAPIGERLKVALKSIAHPDLKAAGDKVKNRLSWQNVKSNVIKIAAVSAGVVAASLIISASPMAFAGIATLAGSFALGRYIRKKLDERKARKTVDAELEKERQEKEEAARKKAEERAKAKEQGDKDPTRVQSQEPVQQPAQPVQQQPAAPVQQQPVQPGQPVTPVAAQQGDNQNGQSSAQVNPEDYIIDLKGTMVYDTKMLSEAEEDLGMDNAIYNEITGSLALVQAQIFELESKELSDEEKEQLKMLKAEEIRLMKDRLKITKVMVEKHEIVLSNLEHSARTR